MSNFFTPIEVTEANPASIEEYEVEKYNHDPFQPTPIQIESLSDQRKKVIQWYSNVYTGLN